MKLRFTFLFIPILLFFQQSPAQQTRTFTVSGFVKDASSGESMLGAGVYIRDTITSTYKGAYTNTYGFYSITLPAGNYTMVVSFLGYNEQRFILQLDHDIRQNVSLGARIVETGEVTIVAEKEDKNIQKS